MYHPSLGIDVSTLVDGLLWRVGYEVGAAAAKYGVEYIALLECHAIIGILDNHIAVRLVKIIYRRGVLRHEECVAESPGLHLYSKQRRLLFLSSIQSKTF